MIKQVIAIELEIEVSHSPSTSSDAGKASHTVYWGYTSLVLWGNNIANSEQFKSLKAH